MNAPSLKPWTQGQFFAWAAHQEGRWEFDGFRPMAMTEGTANHNLIGQNVIAALCGRLRGSPCRPFGQDMGMRTNADEQWKALTLTGDDVLQMPEIGVEIQVAEFYEDVYFGTDLTAELATA